MFFRVLVARRCRVSQLPIWCDGDVCGRADPEILALGVVRWDLVRELCCTC
jgi:hypothetical protein